MQVITARDSNEIKGILPFFAKNTIHGMVVNSLPFFGSYGGVIANSVDIHKKILEKLNQFNKENDVLSSVIINNPFMSNNYVYEKFFKYNSKEDRQIQCISLSNFSKEGLWYSFEQRVRRAVRKAEKNLLSIE